VSANIRLSLCEVSSGNCAVSASTRKIIFPHAARAGQLATHAEIRTCTLLCLPRLAAGRAELWDDELGAELRYRSGVDRAYEHAPGEKRIAADLRRKEVWLKRMALLESIITHIKTHKHKHKPTRLRSETCPRAHASRRRTRRKDAHKSIETAHRHIHTPRVR